MTTHGRSTVKKLKVHFQIKRGPKSKHANTRRNSSTVRGLFTLLTLTHCSLFAIRSSLFTIHISPIPNPISFQLQQVSRLREGQRGVVGRVSAFFGVWQRQKASGDPSYGATGTAIVTVTTSLCHPCHAAQWDEHAELIAIFVSLFIMLHFFIINLQFIIF